MRIRLIASALVMVALAASPALAHQEVLAGAEWVLSGETGPRAPFLRFDAGRVGGLGGCNHFGGTYTLEGDRLSFSPFAATRMACPGDAMQKEQAFFDMLGRVKGMRIDGDRLDLLDGDGLVIARFAKRVAE